MTSKRLQNRIAESRKALPFTAAYALSVCIACGAIGQRLWIPTFLLALSTLLVVELNNVNALIRIYSRMTSCSFLVLSVMATFLFPSIEGGIVQLCFISSYLCMFRAYQDPQATGWVYYAFLSLGIASILFPQILFFVPLLWLLLRVHILALSWRTFWASVLGLLTPYWLIGGWQAFQGDFLWLPHHFVRLADFHPLFDYRCVDEHQIVTFAFVSLLALIGSIHFLRHSYLDKIRTRMLYELLISVDVATMAFIILQPQHAPFLLRILIVNTAPLIGHFLALTQTRLTNIVFCILILMALAITAYNLWMPSLIF